VVPAVVSPRQMARRCRTDRPLRLRPRCASRGGVRPSCSYQRGLSPGALFRNGRTNFPLPCRFDMASTNLVAELTHPQLAFLGWHSRYRFVGAPSWSDCCSSLSPSVSQPEHLGTSKAQADTGSAVSWKARRHGHVRDRGHHVAAHDNPKRSSPQVSHYFLMAWPRSGSTSRRAC